MDNNRRVAKNTAYLYMRMLFTMAVSLYTSRIVLSTLGEVDYGIYNVVGGVITMFAFLNNSMSAATQRFLTIAIGRQDINECKTVFSNSVRIHLILGAVVVLLCETVGLWFVNYKLTIPADRMFAANIVYQFAIVSFFLSVTQVPYNAAIIAHERMDVYAYISIIEVVLRLLLVFVLVHMGSDKLIMFALLSFLVTQLIRILYFIYCRKAFDECKSSSYTDQSLFKEMFGFAGWNVFGSLSWMLKDQGVNMLLNIFFGPVVNAARGVALQVSNAVQAFVTNFTTAINPQITKHYAQGNTEEMEKLAYRGSRFAFLLLFIICFPLMLNLDFILNLWLVKIPEYTPIFVMLILIDAMISSLFGTPIITSIMATGVIRTYQIVVSMVMLLIVPVGYFVFREGGLPYMIFVVMIVISLLSGIVRFSFCVKQIGYKWGFFIKDVLFRVVSTVLLAIPVPILLRYSLRIESHFMTFFFLSAFAVVSSSIAILVVGITKNERNFIIDVITSRIKSVVKR